MVRKKAAGSVPAAAFCGDADPEEVMQFLPIGSRLFRATRRRRSDLESRLTSRNHKVIPDAGVALIT